MGSALSAEPVPYIRVLPDALSPILLTCEHAASRLPAGMASASRALREILESHWGWDIGAWPLTSELARSSGSSALGGRWSRLLVDLNRRVGDATLIRREAGGVLLPWNRRLQAAETERRILSYHVPYHAEVDRLILRRLVRGIRPLLVSIHTFTPELDGERRRFDAGVLFGEHGPLARRLGRALRDCGLTVRYNEPYSGLAGMMYAIDRHGAHHRLACLELEFNQALVGQRSGVRRLAAILARTLPLLTKS